MDAATKISDSAKSATTDSALPVRQLVNLANPVEIKSPALDAASVTAASGRAFSERGFVNFDSPFQAHAHQGQEKFGAADYQPQHGRGHCRDQHDRGGPGADSADRIREAELKLLTTELKILEQEMALLEKILAQLKNPPATEQPHNPPPTDHPHNPSPSGSIHGIKFGPAPSWADDTAINNNNHGKVAPAFYAKRIGDNATYLDASIKQKTSGFDEGEMIDERGMKPSDLVTIPIYGADQDFLTNNSNGKYYGTVQVPRDLQILREGHTYKDGTRTAGNSTVTIITPDGKEMNFAQTYIGPNASLRAEGNVLIGVPVGHGASYMGNEGLITNEEIAVAVKDGIAPAHALNLTVPLNIESSTGGGFLGPAIAADRNYQKNYTGTNPNLKQGTLLAVPKDVTPEQLGLETNMGRALLATMEEFGGYVDNSTHNGSGVYVEAQRGATAVAGMPDHNSFAFSQSAFSRDFSKILAAAKIIPPSV
ncbi:MAG: hypothetical protein JSS86_05760 [Cyanobacteria bacterium SZAS LIN-2]|nr:hypothetical protein [Cyanobacteria bacterium SZAS LIN-2]